MTTTTATALAPRQAGARAARTAWLEGGVLRVDGLFDDRHVTQEASRWASGRRGAAATAAELDVADLEVFVREAMSLGARVLGHASDAIGVASLGGEVSRLAERAESAGASLVRGAADAAEQTAAVAARAAREATEAAGLAVTAALARFREDSAQALDARVAMVGQRLDALLAGESSEVSTGVRQVIASALAEGQAGWQASAAQTLAEMQRTFSPSNPANPLAAVASQIDEAQRRSHADLVGRLDRVGEMVAAAAGAATAATALAETVSRSPGKGLDFEEAVAGTVEVIAAGMGASYERTGARVGNLRNCKKGDAVLELGTARAGDRPVRVLVEVTAQVSGRDWTSYFREAERNRDCQVSVGVVRAAAQVPGGDSVALLGSGRAVVAFDPASDDSAVLRAVLMMVAVEGQRRAVAGSGSDLSVVDEKVVGARLQLAEVVALAKVATGVRDGAGKIVTGLESLHASLAQTLDQALAALRSQAQLAA